MKPTPRAYYSYNNKCEVTYQVLLTSRVFPVFEVTTSQEAFYELLKTIGAADQLSSYSIDILPREYRSWNFIMGVSFENAPGSSFSGISTRNGDQLVIKLKNAQHNFKRQFDNKSVMPYSYPEYIYTVLEYDVILNLSDTGVQVFD